MPHMTIFAGHYGSGKTQLAVNWALHLRKRGLNVVLCDLDIVNPYFRTADCAALLRQAGIELLASPYANTNLESPALPPSVGAVFDDTSRHAVLDVGGDDRGMLALGRYAKKARPGSFDLWMVVNCYRPLSDTPETALALLREMEAAAGLCFTGLVNNANLGTETTKDVVAAGEPYINKLAELSGLPVVMTCARRDITGLSGHIFPVDLFENRFLIH